MSLGRFNNSSIVIKLEFYLLHSLYNQTLKNEAIKGRNVRNFQKYLQRQISTVARKTFTFITIVYSKQCTKYLLFDFEFKFDMKKNIKYTYNTFYNKIYNKEIPVRLFLYNKMEI